MKRVITSLVSLCLAACLAFPAGALDYTIAAPGDPVRRSHFHRTCHHGRRRRGKK